MYLFMVVLMLAVSFHILTDILRVCFCYLPHRVPGKRSAMLNGVLKHALVFPLCQVNH